MNIEGITAALAYRWRGISAAVTTVFTPRAAPPPAPR